MKANRISDILIFAALISLLMFRGASCDFKHQISSTSDSSAEETPSASSMSMVSLLPET